MGEKMLACFSTDTQQTAVVIKLVQQNEYSTWLTTQPSLIKNWLMNTQFKADAGEVRLIPNSDGQLQYVIVGLVDNNSLWNVGHLPFLLPEGYYQFDIPKEEYFTNAIGWGLGAYQFIRYKKPVRQPAILLLHTDQAEEIQNIVESIYLVRDCINTPADDMGPAEFSQIAKLMAEKHRALFNEIVGEALLEENYPCIYTVGRASDDAPRLIDLRWGNSAHPKVTLVGKGVCFDTGGLDIKSSPHMLLMKKDMGGAAHVLGLARMIMQANLPICLRVLIPMVENAISGNAYRPGDVIKSRKGITIEIGNTDAEGRLILSDALTEAVSEKPDLLIDIATLTGAARVALGTELPAVFSNCDAVVDSVLQHAEQQYDFVWRMPLFANYREHLNSLIADINNHSSDGYGGAISAALFLQEFVPNDIPWLHFDLMAWNMRAKPGRPQGGEAMGLRALFSYLRESYR